MEQQTTRYRCRIAGCQRTFETETKRDEHEAHAPHDEPQFELVEE